MEPKLLYQGDLDDTKKIYALIDEIKDIARTYGWRYEETDTSWNKAPEARMTNCDVRGMKFIGTNGMKGLNIIPSEGHEIPLLFDAKGALKNTFQVAMNQAPHYPGQRQWVSAHPKKDDEQLQNTLQSLFEYLKSKYISNLDYRFYPREKNYDPTGTSNHYSKVIDSIEKTSNRKDYPSFDAYMKAVLEMLDRLF